MAYDLDNPRGGVQDCPKCRHTMEPLRRVNAIPRNEGYLLDDGTDRNGLTFLLWGWEGLIIKLLYRNVLEPLLAKLWGQRRQDRYARILHDYPNSLLCPHCHFLLKRK
jgi:hypothetical protein